MDPKKSLIYNIYTKLFKVNIYKSDEELNILAQLLYRRLLKHIHLNYRREISRISKIEEFKWIFTQIYQEPNIHKQYEYLRVVDEIVDKFERKVYPPMPFFYELLTTTSHSRNSYEYAIKRYIYSDLPDFKLK